MNAQEFIRTVEDEVNVAKNSKSDIPDVPRVVVALVMAATLRVLATARNDLDSSEGVAAAYELEVMADDILQESEGH